VITLPVALSGATLPLLFHTLRREVQDLGSVAGRLYGWNTLGSLLGALLGGYVFLFFVDLHQVYRLALAALAAAAVLVSVRRLETRRLELGAAACAFVCSVLLALPSWAPERLASGPFRERQASAATSRGPNVFFAARVAARIRFYDDDPTGSIAVKQYDRSGRRMDRSIVVNGKPDGAALAEYVTMGLLSLLPALLAEKAERSFVIGYGTGGTAGELVSLDSMREVVVAEISPAVIRAAPLFDFANRQTSRSPKLRIVQGDAYRTLSRTDEKFDVITSMPSNPWVEGIEMLYSREFLEAVRAHLAPGGVHAQWFHVYETDTATIELVLRTCAEVFDHVAVWYGLGHDIILLGFESASSATDLERLLARMRRSDFAAGLRRVRIGSLPALLAHELLPTGVIHAARLDGALHTLLHPRLGYMAARAFFVGSQGRLPLTAGPEPARVAQRYSLVQRLAEPRGGRLLEADFARLAEETCYHRLEECLALLAGWEVEHPGSERRTELEDRVRRAAERGGRRLPERDALLRLYDRDSGSTATDPVAAAVEATEVFTRYYHHAVPFSRGVLIRDWQRCSRLEPVRCRQAMAAESSALDALGLLGVALEEE
jgi:spermidine synthase